MPGIIYKAIWTFLILIANAYDTISWLILLINFNFSKCLRMIKNPSSHQDIYFLQNVRKDLTKVPRHLSIVIGQDNVSPETLSRIAVYALITGIDYISYYDIKGEFIDQLDYNNLPKYINRQRMQNGRFLWSMHADKRKTGLLKYKNGLEKSIEVIFLTEKDGKPLLAEVCKELCQQKNTPDMLEAIADHNKLSKHINLAVQRRLHNLPEPDLAVIFDQAMCTYGLLPWHTGFTEFELAVSGNLFDVKMFANVLYKFSKCEQRFGK